MSYLEASAISKFLNTVQSWLSSLSRFICMSSVKSDSKICLFLFIVLMEEIRYFNSFNNDYRSLWNPLSTHQITCALSGPGLSASGPDRPGRFSYMDQDRPGSSASEAESTVTSGPFTSSGPRFVGCWNSNFLMLCAHLLPDKYGGDPGKFATFLNYRFL